MSEPAVFHRHLPGNRLKVAYEVAASELKYDGAIIRVRADTVTQPDGSQAEREVVEHTNSVAIVAVDDARRVLLIRQYRHPVGQYLWELPAGLCDQPGEDPLVTARRELAEETGWTAADWSTLVDVYTSPGISTEQCRIYQARELRPGPRAGPREAEEADLLQQRWTPLAEAVFEVLSGNITNGLAVAGLLATAVRHGMRDSRRPNRAIWPTARG
jgi:8-oxo-dGTP pyrophosphatase MutT (NUDIX family)